MSKIDQLLDRASEKFAAAEVLAKHEHFDDAVSRMFYGLLFCARALLLTKEISSEAPDEIISAFDKECVKKGIMDAEAGKLLKETRKMAQKADLAPSFGVSEEKIRTFMEEAELFMEQAEDAISELED
ncbi:MAG: HEPN domain-containing protein [Theionarchaea archaeon]|nr:HEPN domain-containing protein [Theionarchaea archaeon]